MKTALLERLRSRRQAASVPKWPSFSSFEAAATHGTYENPHIIEVVARKTELLRRNLQSEGTHTAAGRQVLQNLLVLSLCSRGGPISIIDIGGACGANFFILDSMLPGRIARWAVVETPTMLEIARNRFATARLTFHKTLDEAQDELETPDLLIASGVLQYLPNPLQALRHWLGADFDAIYITRSLVSRSANGSCITNQTTRLADHGPVALNNETPEMTLVYPMAIVREEEVASAIEEGYRVAFDFEEELPRTVRIGNEWITIMERGWLGLRKDC